jgi:hypothetical protein
MRTQESIAAVRRDGDLAEWVAFANEAATAAAGKVAENDHLSPGSTPARRRSGRWRACWPAGSSLHMSSAASS